MILLKSFKLDTQMFKLKRFWLLSHNMLNEANICTNTFYVGIKTFGLLLENEFSCIVQPVHYSWFVIYLICYIDLWTIKDFWHANTHSCQEQTMNYVDNNTYRRTNEAIHHNSFNQDW